MSLRLRRVGDPQSKFGELRPLPAPLQLVRSASAASARFGSLIWLTAVIF
jgi:hypothetical protein